MLKALAMDIRRVENQEQPPVEPHRTSVAPNMDDIPLVRNSPAVMSDDLRAPSSTPSGQSGTVSTTQKTAEPPRKMARKAPSSESSSVENYPTTSSTPANLSARPQRRAATVVAGKSKVMATAGKSKIVPTAGKSKAMTKSKIVVDEADGVDEAEADPDVTETTVVAKRPTRAGTLRTKTETSGSRAASSKKSSARAGTTDEDTDKTIVNTSPLKRPRREGAAKGKKGEGPDRAISTPVPNRARGLNLTFGLDISAIEANISSVRSSARTQRPKK